MEMKYVVPDMAQSFGTLEFAGESEPVFERDKNNRKVIARRSYNLYSDVQKGENVVVEIPVQAGEKKFKYEQKVKLVNPKLYGRGYAIGDMGHTDYLHLVFVPLTKDNRLCAKEIIGNRANLTKWQDDFHACMVEQYPDLERGESASKTGRKHIPTRLFKQAVNLSKQARAIEAVLSGITPLNAGKKKEEALSMLKKWFPQMENFSGQLKKYKVTINDLLAENEKLEVRAKASEKGKMNDTMERAKLKSELDDMRRLVDRIPPEILAELKRQQRQHGKER